jgi:S-formylglutathione hydrolase FrmB
MLGRRLSEVTIIPPGGSSGGLLVLLHVRHNPGPLHDRTGPESMLNDSLVRAVARLGARAPIVVLLNGGGHSYFHDRRDGRWGSSIRDEAIPDAVRRFHASQGRIAIGGISIGGYGAFLLASTTHRHFCAVGGHSAALWAESRIPAPGAFDDAEDYRAHDVFAAARQGRLDGMPIWIDGGRNDPFRAADAALASVLRNRGDPVSYHVWPGGHTGSYWHAHMATYLGFYARSLKACAGAQR